MQLKSVAPLLALLVFQVIPAKATDMGETRIMKTKTINYRGGLVTFDIPQHWKEEYQPEGGGMFYEDGPATGTLRLNVITAKSPQPITSNSTVEALVGLKAIKPSEVEKLSNSNAIAKSVKRTSEQGTAITLFWWYVANAVPPQHVRVATFSYTVLTSNEKLSTTVADIKFIEASIRNARFHPALGE